MKINFCTTENIGDFRHGIRGAIKIPDRAERQRLGLFLQCEPRREIALRFRDFNLRRLDQRDVTTK